MSQAEVQTFGGGQGVRAAWAARERSELPISAAGEPEAHSSGILGSCWGG